MNYNVVNFHVINECNYGCTYCFGKFDCHHPLPLKDAKRIVDEIAKYFREKNISSPRINLAGGEPTIYKHLDELIDYIHSLGISVSIVTNGSHLTQERVRSWKGKVSCIGISIDSLVKETNLKIGRENGGRTLSLDDVRLLAEEVHSCGIALKLNTVVSKLNLTEDLTELYRATQPQRIKIFKMHLVKDVNDSAIPLSVTDSEFHSFCQRHKGFDHVCEKEGDMENSYVMIDPKGALLLNDNGRYTEYGNLFSQPLSALMGLLPLEQRKYNGRYQKEDCVA